MNGSPITVNLNMTGFNNMFNTLAAVVPEDSKTFIITETARLAEECASQLSRRTPIAKGGMLKDIRSVFDQMPKNPVPESHRNGHGMKWIQAGPEWLVGVKPLRYHIADTPEDMYRLFYKSKGTLPIERRSVLGVHGRSGRWNFRKNKARGNQIAYEKNRLVVSRGAYRDFIRMLKLKIGRLEASFALTAKILRGSQPKVKAYIARHLNGEPLANITNLMASANPESPRIEFGSTAPGILNFTDQIQAAINIRAEKMMQRWKLIVAGYSRDMKRSIAPRRYAKTVEAIE